MAENSKIEWTDHTFNPWWGCVRVSPGCVHCYAETFDRRVHGVDKHHWGVKAERRFFGDKHWNEPLKWDREAEKEGVRRRVFCASMADVFEDRPELAPWRERLFLLIESTPHLDWLLLTKRPENMVRLATRWADEWPRNVWAGCTVEDQERANERIPHVLRVPAAVRFLSCEPLLERVSLNFDWFLPPNPDPVPLDGRFRLPENGIHWVIIGGESGPGARIFARDWARDLIDQCRRAGVAPFVKQLGAKPDGARLIDAKGGDWTEWRADLRVREFPASAVEMMGNLATG